MKLIELKEMILSNLPPTETYQHLKDQLILIKNEFNTSLLELRVEFQNLQQDRDTVNIELNAV